MTPAPIAPAHRSWRCLAASCALHLGLLAASRRIQPEAPRAPRTELPPVAEVSFEVAPPVATEAPAPAPSAPAEPTARRTAAIARAALPASRVATQVATGELLGPEAPAIPTPSGAGPAEPPSPSPAPSPGPLDAAGLYRAATALGTGLAVDGAARDLSPEGQAERARAVAMAPTLAVLAESRNRLPTGAVVRDRTVARRTQEFLDPYRALERVSERLTTAPVVSLGPLRRPSNGSGSAERETSVGDALDAAHAQSYTTERLGPGYAPCQHYRALRLLAELTHDARGAVTASRVVRSSGEAALDRAALTALQDGQTEVTPLRAADAGAAVTYTRWLVEVGEDRDAHVPIACGSLGGWTVWSSQGGPFGVRVRVRRVREP
ncbi:MAG: hypothetical protein HY909_30895 [Deltaproteobacteria bacterium]|nr:hypothetical protein [Deltaproteobacteria bacterium]